MIVLTPLLLTEIYNYSGCWQQNKQALDQKLKKKKKKDQTVVEHIRRKRASLEKNKASH